jgi:hypothetical protein
VKAHFHVYDPKRHDHVKTATRKVKVAFNSLDRLPMCAWCRLDTLKPVSDLVQHGFERDFVQMVCYCPHCDKGTVVEFECPAERYQ